LISEHARHLDAVFSLLHQHKLFVKHFKCTFVQKSLEYLEHIISTDGVATDPTKNDVV
jgi:hypothetical protein